MKVCIISAMDPKRSIGRDNSLMWNIPKDMSFFRKVTMGNVVVMGRKTYESIGKPLPNRTTIIVTRNKEYFQEGCLTASSLEEAIEICKNEKTICIVGGEQIYRQALENNLVDSLEITLVHHEFDADAFFPKIDKTIWEEISREDFKADEKNKYDYSFLKYQKKSN